MRVLIIERTRELAAAVTVDERTFFARQFVLCGCDVWVHAEKAASMSGVARAGEAPCNGRGCLRGYYYAFDVE